MNDTNRKCICKSKGNKQDLHERTQRAAGCANWFEETRNANAECRSALKESPSDPVGSDLEIPLPSIRRGRTRFARFLCAQLGRTRAARSGLCALVQSGGESHSDRAQERTGSAVPAGAVRPRAEPRVERLLRSDGPVLAGRAHRAVPLLLWRAVRHVLCRVCGNVLQRSGRGRWRSDALQVRGGAQPESRWSESPSLGQN